jgi:hypothetical protein
VHFDEIAQAILKYILFTNVRVLEQKVATDALLKVENQLVSSYNCSENFENPLVEVNSGYPSCYPIFEPILRFAGWIENRATMTKQANVIVERMKLIRKVAPYLCN